MASHSALLRKSSWKDKLSKKLGVGEKERERVRDKDKDTKLTVTNEDWLFIDDTEMETAFTNGPDTAAKKKSSMRGVLSSPLLGPRSSSVSKSRGEKLPRPVSPHGGGSSLQRRPSGRGSRLEVQNGRASPRSASPNRSSVRKKSGNLQQRRAESPIEPHHHQPHHPPQHHAQKEKEPEAKGSETPPFAKVRDTLRIHRPKKRKAIGNAQFSSHMQYSAPEINLHNPKYQDPFEAQPNFMDSTEERKLGQGHEFKAVGIPHNKPEYCDHCGETAWGLYRQVLKCSKCDFIVHRKCESKVVIDCSSRLEAVLQHDKQVEDCVAPEEESEKEKEEPEPLVRTNSASAGSSSTSASTSTDHSDSPQMSASSHQNHQLITEKAKLVRKIRDYNRKTTPVHHIHVKSSRDHTVDYQGFVRVHMCVQRPIHVSTAITRTSWYRLMRPVKERGREVDGFETAFYLPTDTNRLVHINNTTSTKELVQILLKKFCVTDNPKKFSLYEEYGSDSRRLFEEDYPLQIVLEASCAHRNSRLVLRDNSYHTIQWDAFTLPELSNFIQILHREEDIYAEKIEERFKIWRGCIQQALKEQCMEDISKQTKLNVQTATRDTKQMQPTTASTGRKSKLDISKRSKLESIV